MAPTVTVLDLDHAESVTSGTTASVEPTPGTKVYIVVKSVSENHGNAFSWSISTSDVTWAAEHSSAVEDSDPDFRSQIRVWSTDAWSGAKATTFSAFASGTEQLGWALVEIGDADPGSELAQAIVSSMSASTPTTETVTFGSALTAGTLRLGCWMAEIDGTGFAWDAPPTNFTEVAGGSQTALVVPVELIEATSGTSTAIEHGGDGASGGEFTMAGVLFEFSPAGSDATASPATIAATAAVASPVRSVGAGPAPVASVVAAGDSAVTVSAGPAVTAVTAGLGDAGAGVSAGPTVTAAVASVGGADVTVTAGPAAVAAVTSVGDVDVAVAAAPGVVAAAVAVPQAAPGESVTVAASTIAATAAVGDVGAGVAAGPAAVAAVAAVGDPDITVTAGPAVVAATVAVGDVDVAVAASPAVTAAVVAVPLAAAGAGAGVTPATTGAVAAIPQAATSVAVGPGTVAAVSAVPVVAVAAAVVVVEAPSTGGWAQLASIVSERAQYRQVERSAQPTECPNDGTPLLMDRHGQLFCPWDGWRPDLSVARPTVPSPVPDWRSDLPPEDPRWGPS